MLSSRRILIAALCALAVPVSSASAYVGGHDALKDKPFVVGLHPNGDAQFFCTGTLIHPEWVLTAAHCLDQGKTAFDVIAVIGETNLDDTTDPAEQHRVDRLVLHPDWGDDGDGGDDGDVALVHLSTPSAIAPVRLGITPALVDGTTRCMRQITPGGRFGGSFNALQTCVAGTGKALGWGRRSTSQTTRTLREVTPKIMGWPQNGFWRTKAGACPGDSGGPLLALAADGSPRQIGVASYNSQGGGIFDWLVGDACSTKGMDFYANVSAGSLRTWIESITRVRDHRD